MELVLSILLLISILSFAIFNIIEIVCSIKFYKRIQREHDEFTHYLTEELEKILIQRENE